ncbi:MAG: efflux RND transporter periplasmic adaptor subunit [Alphaproteobacteria bacterium]
MRPALGFFLAAALAAGAGSDAFAQASPGRTAVAVEAQAAITAQVEHLYRTLGEIVAINSVEITTQRAGVIQQLNFVEGTDVEAGATLVQIDNRTEQSELRSAASKRDLARQTLQRTQELARLSLRPLAEQQRDAAALVAAEAEYQARSVALDILAIKAPFDGVITGRRVSAGAFVSPGQTIAVLQNLDRLRVRFRLPQRLLSDVRPGQLMRVTPPRTDDRTFVTSRVSSVDPVLDAATRLAIAEGVIDNSRSLLRPGSFVRIAVVTKVVDDAVVVPSVALVQSLTGDFVFVVEGDKARRVRVRIGERRDGFAEIEEGVATGALVVTEGQFKLEDGSTVQVVQSGK